MPNSKEYNKEYYKKNKEKIKAKCKEYYKKNREKIRARQEIYDQAHREERKESAKRRYIERKELWRGVVTSVREEGAWLDCSCCGVRKKATTKFFRLHKYKGVQYFDKKCRKCYNAEARRRYAERNR